MMNYRYKYTLPDNGEVYEDAREFESAFDFANDPEWVAEDAAGYDHDECDGRLDSWPKVIELWSLDGKVLGRFKMELDYNPTFGATKVT